MPALLASRQADPDRLPDGWVIDDDGVARPWWYSRTGYIVKWSVFFGLVTIVALYLVGGYLHAKSRMRKGQVPLGYHRWLISKRELARVDPTYAYPQSTYTNYNSSRYNNSSTNPDSYYYNNAGVGPGVGMGTNMQPMPPPPVYEPASKIDPSQGGRNEYPPPPQGPAPVYEAPPGPPPPSEPAQQGPIGGGAGAGAGNGGMVQNLAGKAFGLLKGRK